MSEERKVSVSGPPNSATLDDFINMFIALVLAAQYTICCSFPFRFSQKIHPDII